MRGIDPQSAADGNRHILVIPGQNPHIHMEPVQLFNGSSGTLLGCIKERQIPQQGQTVFIVLRDGLLIQRFIRHCQNLHAVLQHLIHNGVDAGMRRDIDPVAFSLVFDMAAFLADFVHAALDDQQILFSVAHQDTGKPPLVVKRQLVQLLMLLRQLCIMLFLSGHLSVSQDRFIQVILYPCMVEAV